MKSLKESIRSSCPKVFLGKGILKICSKFTGEHPSRSVISIKLQRNFVKITLQHGCSLVNLLHVFRTPFHKNISGQLLLQYVSLNVSTFKAWLQSLAIKLYKIKENLSNEITSSTFPPRLIIYNLRTRSDFFRNSVNSCTYGLNSIRFFASKVWQMAPMEIKI